uniref:DH domain-containing protein n=1 Tax=Anas zonorhyncha TaxID=75864 RepID=A0A8B9UCH9_9AVES
MYVRCMYMPIVCCEHPTCAISILCVHHDHPTHPTRIPRMSHVCNTHVTRMSQFAGAEGRWFRKISARFCSRQPFALEQLKAKQRKDARFAQFVQEAESQARCRRLQLKDIIATEMQRLTKYPLLLQSITACTGGGTPKTPKKFPKFPQKSKNIQKSPKIPENPIKIHPNPPKIP